MQKHRITQHPVEVGPRSSIARSFAGPGVPLPEIQIGFRNPDSRGRGRLTTLGVPPSEIRQIASTVLQSSLVQDLDRAIQVRLLGVEKYQRRYGLALAIAMLSGVMSRAVPRDFIFIGEIDLYRRVRDVPDAVLQNLLTSLSEGGISTPVTLVVPPSAADFLSGAADVTVVACATIADAIGSVWPDLAEKKMRKQ